MATTSRCRKCGWTCELPGRQVAARCPECGNTVIWYSGGSFAKGGWLLFVVPFAVVALFFVGILGFCVCTGGLALLSQPTARTPTTGAGPAGPAEDPAGRPPVIGRPEVPKRPPPPPAGVTPRK